MLDTINKAKVSIRLEDGTTIKGLLNIGKYNRLSDFLNSRDADPFLIVYEASMQDAEAKVIIINRDHIDWALPDELG